MAATTLGAQESKWLLSLSGDLPEEYSTTWVTVDEMLGRLIEGGVDRALTKEHLEYAVKHHNRGGAYLSQRGNVWRYFVVHCIISMPLAPQSTSGNGILDKGGEIGQFLYLIEASFCQPVIRH